MYRRTEKRSEYSIEIITETGYSDQVVYQYLDYHEHSQEDLAEMLRHNNPTSSMKPKT